MKVPNLSSDPTGETYLIQLGLAKLGLYHGEADNQNGPLTTEALTAFAQARNAQEEEEKGGTVASARVFKATKAEVHNRGFAPNSFLTEMIEWARTAPDFLFAPDDKADIYARIENELGPFMDLLHRKAAMIESMRVLALFESGCNWSEGVDSTRRTTTSNENAEAGAWQVSFDARKLDAGLAAFLTAQGISDGLAFQQRMKDHHFLAMDFIARLLRIDIRNYNRIANGPVRKGDERKKTWPDRPKLWDAKESIYPWLSREAVAEFAGFLA